MIQTKYSRYDYLNISDSDDIWGLYVLGAGIADVPPHTIYPPTKHPVNYMFNCKHGRTLPSFQLLYITKGEGIFETKRIKRTIVKEGSLIFLYPNEWHTYRPNKKTGWKEYWISFNGEQPRKFLEKNILHRDKPIIEIGLNETIVNLFNQILELLENESLGFREIISSLAYQIIAQINSVNRRKQFGGKQIEKVILEAKIYLAENISHQVNFKELANELNVGYSWFRRMFQHYTHLPPSQYFQLLKLNKAKTLLIGTSMHISEISDFLGFENQYYFSKFFKKRTEFSPSSWRKHYQTKQ
ncbi:MAG: AraC family transcriptional regulator [Melioribacteraceae bacterium]